LRVNFFMRIFKLTSPELNIKWNYISHPSIDITLGITESRQLTPGDFTYLMQIGKGSFGRVYLATMNGCNENKYYAIKTLEKKKILQKNETTHINCERKVLIDNLKHPFLVSLKYSFQTVDKLYFVLDYVNGKGDNYALYFKFKIYILSKIILWYG
jgi:serine/threonine protein kinase